VVGDFRQRGREQRAGLGIKYPHPDARWRGRRRLQRSLVEKEGAGAGALLRRVAGDADTIPSLFSFTELKIGLAGRGSGTQRDLLEHAPVAKDLDGAESTVVFARGPRFNFQRARLSICWPR